MLSAKGTEIIVEIEDDDLDTLLQEFMSLVHSVFKSLEKHYPDEVDFFKFCLFTMKDDYFEIRSEEHIKEVTIK